MAREKWMNRPIRDKRVKRGRKRKPREEKVNNEYLREGKLRNVSESEVLHPLGCEKSAKLLRLRLYEISTRSHCRWSYLAYLYI